jgi:Uma2 family endonuclease
MRIPATVDEPVGWMSRAEYRLWAEGRPGRFERINGQVVAMAAERVGHARIKGKVYMALTAAVETSGLPCEVLVDGPTIEVGESDYEPDVIVRCGFEVISDDSLMVPDAMVIVEVLSPTTRRTDVSQKLADYFQIPSAHHYLILFADRVQAIHHRRNGDGIETRVLTGGDVTLDPPGIAVPLGRFLPRGRLTAGGLTVGHWPPSSRMLAENVRARVPPFRPRQPPRRLWR